MGNSRGRGWRCANMYLASSTAPSPPQFMEPKSFDRQKLRKAFCYVHIARSSNSSYGRHKETLSYTQLTSNVILTNTHTLQIGWQSQAIAISGFSHL
jgi:hypothetical protein